MDKSARVGMRRKGGRNERREVDGISFVEGLVWNLGHVEELFVVDVSPKGN